MRSVVPSGALLATASVAMLLAAPGRFSTITALPQRKVSENFIGGDPHDAGSDLDYYVWLARSGSRVFVIDTGFDAAVGARRGRRTLTPPAQALARLGVDAKSVKDVIITHLHYDHVGNWALFPAATFHLQDDEMAY